MRRVCFSSSFGKLFWVAYVSITLVFVQALPMHIHAYDHHPTAVHDLHVEQAHPAFMSHDYDSDKLADIDLSNPGVVKKVSFDLLIVALITAVIMLLAPPLRAPAQSRTDGPPRRPWRGFAPPSLRAPPQ